MTRYENGPKHTQHTQHNKYTDNSFEIHTIQPQFSQRAPSCVAKMGGDTKWRQQSSTQRGPNPSLPERVTTAHRTKLATRVRTIGLLHLLHLLHLRLHTHKLLVKLLHIKHRWRRPLLLLRLLLRLRLLLLRLPPDCGT